MNYNFKEAITPLYGKYNLYFHIVRCEGVMILVTGYNNRVI